MSISVTYCFHCIWLWDSSVLMYVVYIMNVAECSMNEWMRFTSAVVEHFMLWLHPNVSPILPFNSRWALSDCSGWREQRFREHSPTCLLVSMCMRSSRYKTCVKKRGHGIGLPSITLPNATAFQSGCTDGHSHQQYMTDQAVLHPRQHSVLPDSNSCQSDGYAIEHY